MASKLMRLVIIHGIFFDSAVKFFLFLNVHLNWHSVYNGRLMSKSDRTTYNKD